MAVYTYEGNIIRDSRDENADTCDNATASTNAKGFQLPASKEWELAARYINGIDWLPWNYASGDLSGPCYALAEGETAFSSFCSCRFFHKTRFNPY